MDEYRIALQAEDSFAGCLLVDAARTLSLSRGICSEDDFSGSSAKLVFSVARELVSAGKSADPIIIKHEIERQGHVIEDNYLASCMRGCATLENVPEISRVIHEKAVQRRTREVGQAIAFDGLDPVTAIERLQAIVQGAGNRVPTSAEDICSFMDQLGDTGGVDLFLPTGFDALDAQLGGGLIRGGLITFAARPGTGKSTVAINIAENFAEAGRPVLYFSFEMPRGQITACRLAAESGLSRSKITAHKVVEDRDWQRLTDAASALYKRPFQVVDKPCRMEDIEIAARCVDGLSLIVVDHIGLVRPTQQGSRYEVLTDISHRLKQLALSLEIPILALAQLNRQSEARSDKRPTMADVRDSGAVEEDSDVVGLLFRPAVYLPEDERPKPWEAQALDIFIDKSRHSPVGGVRLDFYGVNARII